MTKLQQRMKKLEGFMTDPSGLVPHVKKWLEYWTARIDEILEQENSSHRKIIPIEAVRAWMQAQPDTDWKYEHDSA
jgi:uncharacterized protein Usg